MGWQLAGSLVQLRAQLNQLYPNRSKISDGTIGDAAHAASVSDHNPDSSGTVRAFDCTHDPAGGVDGNWLAGQLQRSRDPRIKYVIWNRRIMAGNAGPSPWVWRAYHGSNPHDHHVHVSVVAGAAGNSATSWSLAASPTSTQEADMSAEDVRQIVERIDAVGGETQRRIARIDDVLVETQRRVTSVLATVTGSTAQLRDTLEDALNQLPTELDVDVDQLAHAIVVQLLRQTMPAATS